MSGTLKCPEKIIEVYEKYKNGVKDGQDKIWVRDMSRAIDGAVEGDKT